MNSAGWLLVIPGLCIVALGAFLLLGGSFSWLGRLPGDIRVQGARGGFYFPITTCLLLSIVLSALVWQVRWFSRSDQRHDAGRTSLFKRPPLDGPPVSDLAPA